MCDVLYDTSSKFTQCVSSAETARLSRALTSFSLLSLSLSLSLSLGFKRAHKQFIETDHWVISRRRRRRERERSKKKGERDIARGEITLFSPDTCVYPFCVAVIGDVTLYI